MDANRKREFRELELIVSGIATFANESVQPHNFEELYEISLHVLYAADAFLKVDLNNKIPSIPDSYSA